MRARPLGVLSSWRPPPVFYPNSKTIAKAHGNPEAVEVDGVEADVVLGEIRSNRNRIAFDKHWKIPYRWNVYGSTGPVAKHGWQKEKIPKALEYSEATGFNRDFSVGGDSKTGIITCGIASNYVRESLKRLDAHEKVHLMVLGVPYPAPRKMVTEFLARCEKVLCVEEGEALIERQIIEIARAPM